MGEVRQRGQQETPIPGWPGWTEEKAEREAERIEHDEFESVDGRWVIPIGPGPSHEASPDWPGSISVTPAELEKLTHEADIQGISVRGLLERQIAEDRSG